MTEYDELVQQMRTASTSLGGLTDRAGLLHQGAVAITALVQHNAEVAAAESAAISRSGTELRIAAAHLAAQQGNGPRDASRWLAFLEDAAVREARPKGEWVAGADDETMDARGNLERIVGEALGAASTAWTGTPTGVFESSYVSGIVDALMASIDVYADGEGSHVEIGGQRMTQAQYDAARHPLLAWPNLESQIAAETATWDGKGYTQEHDDEHGREHVLIQAMQYAIKRRYAAALALLERAAMTPVREPEPTPPAHGLAVGDVLTFEQMENAPTGLLVEDHDGDQWKRTDDDADEPWCSVNQGAGGLGAHYRFDEFEHYRPFTVVAVPAPANLVERAKVGD